MKHHLPYKETIIHRDRPPSLARTPPPRTMARPSLAGVLGATVSQALQEAEEEVTVLFGLIRSTARGMAILGDFVGKDQMTLSKRCRNAMSVKQGHALFDLYLHKANWGELATRASSRSMEENPRPKPLNSRWAPPSSERATSSRAKAVRTNTTNGNAAKTTRSSAQAENRKKEATAPPPTESFEKQPHNRTGNMRDASRIYSPPHVSVESDTMGNTVDITRNPRPRLLQPSSRRAPRANANARNETTPEVIIEHIVSIEREKLQDWVSHANRFIVIYGTICNSLAFVSMAFEDSIKELSISDVGSFFALWNKLVDSSNSFRVGVSIASTCRYIHQTNTSKEWTMGFPMRIPITSRLLVQHSHQMAVPNTMQVIITALAEGFVRCAIHAHRRRSNSRKHHQQTISFPHTADPPLNPLYTAVPVFENRDLYKSIDKYHRFSDLHLQKRDQSIFPNKALDKSVRASALSALDFILEACKQTIYIAIARAYISTTLLQTYQSVFQFTLPKRREDILRSSHKSNMANPHTEPEFDARLWEILSSRGSSSPETALTDYTPRSNLSPEMDLFDQFPPPPVDNMFPETPGGEAWMEFVNPDLLPDPCQPPSVAEQLEGQPPFEARPYGPYTYKADVSFDPSDAYMFQSMAPPTGEVISVGGTVSEPSPESTAFATPEGSASPSVEPGFSCDFPNCGKGGFKRRCDLRKHAKTHDKNLFCKYRGKGCTAKGFSSEKDKRRHEQTIHEQKNKFHCPVCGTPKSRRDNLKDHMRRIHR